MVWGLANPHESPVRNRGCETRTLRGQRRPGKMWDGSVRPTCSIIKTKMVFPGKFPFVLWNNEVPSLYFTPQHSICPVFSQTYYFIIVLLFLQSFTRAGVCLFPRYDFPLQPALSRDPLCSCIHPHTPTPWLL